ncbi:ABC transporter substrate-binding protein [Dyella sp. BiH032]|uniref:heme/hemin ABC transporter substrate-binding protein n=1 Tax=Dyella sp. BiH032 TaxID=3075430 RepID=UPI002892ED37|nr:ABC transporter substrate-binding protein [Dyella sp. BiH032]WNL44148.1 ABC transporter substrate-binding protein [Dyella sp. BiH032]
MAERTRCWIGAVALAFCAQLSPAFAAEAPRVVALGGDITETVYALEAQGALVGVDSTSQWPAAAHELPDVGYVRQLAAEGVLALRPTLILATHDAGPPPVIAQLRDAGVRIELMPTTRTPEGVAAKVRAVGHALGRDAAAASLAARLASAYAALAQAVAAMPRHPRVLFLMATEGSPKAAGRETAAASAIALAGGTHAGDGFTGYKAVSPEALAALAPDVILLMREREEAVGGVEGVLRLPGVALTPAGRQRRIEFVDGQALLGFGPRNAEHEQRLQRLLADLRP